MLIALIKKNKQELSIISRMYVPLPGLTKDNHKVIYCKVTNSDPSLFNMADCCKLYDLIVVSHIFNADIGFI